MAANTIDADAMKQILGTLQLNQQTVLTNLQNNHQAALAHQQQQLATLLQNQQIAGGALGAKNNAAIVRSLHVKDLPQFGAMVNEDPLDFLLRFETLATAQHWQNDDRIQHFSLALQKNALKWLRANPHSQQ